MSAGYLFIEKPLVTASIVGAAICIAGVFARQSLKSSKTPYFPETTFGFKLFFETVTLFIVWLGDTVMGKEGRKYLPFLAILFLYIFLSNLIGLVPGIALATDQLHLDFGLAIVIFGLYNYWSIRTLGLMGFIKHLWGPFFLLGFVLFPIEIISNIIRPVALSIRLFGNLTADHTMLAIFNDLTGGTVLFFFTVPFYFLGFIVCFVQAFVFTLLTMVYIRLGSQHSH